MRAATASFLLVRGMKRVVMLAHMRHWTLCGNKMCPESAPLGKLALFFAYCALRSAPLRVAIDLAQAPQILKVKDGSSAAAVGSSKAL
jgi:hypothetical protein